MSKLNLCWPDRRGVNQCHTYLCDRRPTLQECPLSKGSSPSVIESTWVPCIQKAPFKCREENVKPHSIQPSAPNPEPAPVNVPSVNIASPIPAPTPTSTPAPEPSVPTTIEAPVKDETPAPELKVAQQVTEESEATYAIAGQEITQTNALIGIGVVGALSFALVM